MSVRVPVCAYVLGVCLRACVCERVCVTRSGLRSEGQPAVSAVGQALCGLSGLQPSRALAS